jgi:hypothetical protein
MFGNKFLTKIFGLKRDEIASVDSALHNCKPRDLFIFPAAVTAVKPERLRWIPHVLRIG